MSIPEGDTEPSRQVSDPGPALKVGDEPKRSIVVEKPEPKAEFPESLDAAPGSTVPSESNGDPEADGRENGNANQPADKQEDAAVDDDSVASGKRESSTETFVDMEPNARIQYCTNVNAGAINTDVVTEELTTPIPAPTDPATVLEEKNHYPPLPGSGSTPGYEELGTKLAGIRFAPLRVPFLRRMQTAAVLFHCTSIVSFVAFFFFFAAIPLSWPFVVPYLIGVTLSTAATNGRLSKRSEWLRSLPLWTLFAGYYPATLHKTYDLPPTRKYVFGYHPHGIISHGAWASFATNALGFSEKFPGITNTLLTLDSNFRIPFYRDWILWMGIASVSKEAIWNTLTKGGINNEGMGRAVTIVIGGARESLEAEPGTLRLILKGRKGFVKMALRTGADLVPVLAFGENELYDQLSPRKHPLVRKFQVFILKVFKFTLPAMHGRGLLNYDVGLMPYRRPLNIVVGRPIKVAVAKNPSQPDAAEVDRLHALYVAELQNIWEAYKDQFAKDRKVEMQFIA